MSLCSKFVRRVDDHWEDKEISNPETGRTIKFWKRTFCNIEKNCGTLVQDCSHLKGLSNLGWTCYIDSVLFLLLAFRNKYIDKYILLKKIDSSNISPICSKNDLIKNTESAKIIQDQLLRLAFEIRHGRHMNQIVCRQILNTIRQLCPESHYPDFRDPVQRSPNEFLEFILDLFRFDDSMKGVIRQKSMYKRLQKDRTFYKKFETITITENAHCVWDVPFVLTEQGGSLQKTLQQIETTQLSDPHYDDSDKNRKYPMYYRKNMISYTRLPAYLVFQVGRVNFVTGRFITEKMIPEKEIKGLRLFGVIVHSGLSGNGAISDEGYVGGGHYFCFFRCGDRDSWFRYDDIGASIKRIGNFNTLLKRTTVCTHGVLYFYSK